ncbi:MAG: DUF6718 family protein [Catonella sp.]|jgi:hypothetical protein|nr:DUF6718 family protein [Catonella sp.]
MCYLVAKDVNKHGSIAFRTKHGKHLAELSNSLGMEVKDKGIQIVTISRPAAYGEYSPYRFAKTEEDFVKEVHAMV